MIEAIRRYKARRMRRLRARFDEEDWVTIKGTHVLIDDDGNVTGGPQNLRKIQFKNAKPSARLKRQAQSGTGGTIKPKRAKDCKNIEDLQNYIKEKNWDWTSENPRVSSGKYRNVTFDQLDAEKMSDGIGSIEDFIDDFPDMAGTVKGFRNRASGVACTNGDYVAFSPLYFMKDAERNLDDVIQRNVNNGWWPKGTNVKGILAHEMGHVLMGWMIEHNPDYSNPWERADAWNKGKDANKIVSQACRNVKKTEYGKGKKNDELKKSISGQALDRGSGECFAEAFCDCVCNGENANPLSKEIRRLAIERYKELGGKLR